MTVTRRTHALVALVLTGFLAACSSSSEPESQEEAPQSSYPISIDNCGFEVEFESAPERVVTIKSTTTELLLALGVGDTIIGTAFPDGPIPEDLAADQPQIEILSDRLPSSEAVIDLEPDLIYAGWESNVTAEGVGDRETLQSLGIASYVSSPACQTDGYQPATLSFDDVFAEIEQVGGIFDAAERAEEIVESQREELEAIDADDRDLSALWFSSGSDVPYVGAGEGAPQMILDAAGVANIAADQPGSWTSYSWEAVIDADPDVIVLIDSAWGDTQRKITQLESNPATATLRAVTEERYIVVPFAAGEAGVRNVEAVQTIIEQLENFD